MGAEERSSRQSVLWRGVFRRGRRLARESRERGSFRGGGAGGDGQNPSSKGFQTVNRPSVAGGGSTQLVCSDGREVRKRGIEEEGSSLETIRKTRPGGGNRAVKPYNGTKASV